MSLRLRAGSKPQSPRLNWAAKLAHVVRTRDGKSLRTRGDARAYLIGLPEHEQLHSAWQHLCRLLLDWAAAEAVTAQLELALLLSGALALQEESS